MDQVGFITKEEEINLLLKESKVNTNFISDGYHTFGELYEHRIRLFIALLKYVSVFHGGQRHSPGWIYKDDLLVWKSRRHSDGSSIPGWFIAGIRSTPGEQITYHLPMSYWDEVHYVHELGQAPHFDGHNSSDVLERLSKL